MKTIAELIKLGVKEAFDSGLPQNMCCRLDDLNLMGIITVEEQDAFEKWIAIQLSGEPATRRFLMKRHPDAEGLSDTSWKDSSTFDNLWLNFYVWAYYDLIREGK